MARLHTGGAFQQQIERQFEGDYSVRYHMAPPLLSRKRDARGRPVKKEFGAWLTPILKILAGLRFLRGTPLDPFGYSSDRTLERTLIADYEAFVEKTLDGLSSENLEPRAELARQILEVRGYGPVKEEAAERVRQSIATALPG